MPDPCPSFLNWLPGAEGIVDADQHAVDAQLIIEKSDLIFCLDFNELGRVGNTMQPWLSNAKGFKIMIDHHLFPSDEFDVLFSDISSCSTAQLIYEFIDACGDIDLIDTEIAAGIYCGIMTDSGSFRFPSTTPKTHEVAAHLLSVGLQHSSIYENVYDTNTVERLKLRGYAINEKLEILPEIKTSIISLTKEELVRFRYQRGDTEGLVNVGLSIIGVDKSIFLSEAEGYVKMSFRSKGSDNPINQFASTYFNGGGHANASGGVFEGNMDEALNALREALNKEFK
jgi:bifunctional oligoribonuclease and PAP phosphatase NrnA